MNVIELPKRGASKYFEASPDDSYFLWSFTGLKFFCWDFCRLVISFLAGLYESWSLLVYFLAGPCSPFDFESVLKGLRLEDNAAVR